MSYNILKHLRGTTQEWKDHDLVPEEGELVVEECRDNFCRCKIGDGILPFSKLKYIDDYTIDELNKKISETKDTFTKNLLNLEKLQNDNLAKTKQELIQSLSAESESITAEYLKADQAVLSAAAQAASQSTDSKVSALQQEIQNLITTAISELDKKLSELKDNTSQTLDERTQLLDQKIVNAVENFTSSLTSELKTIDDEFEQKLSEERSEIDVCIENLNQAIKDLKTTTQATLQTITEEQNIRFNSINDTVAVQAEDINVLSSKTTDIVSENKVLSNKLDNAIETLTKSISDTSTELSLDYIDKISTTKKSLEDSISRLTAEHSDSLAAVRNSLSDTIEDLRELHNKDVDDVKVSIDTLSTNTVSRLDQLENANVTSTTEINGQLAQLQARIIKLNSTDEDLVDSVFAVNNRLSDIEAHISSEILSLAQDYTTWLANLHTQVQNIEEAQLVINSDFLNTLHTYVTNIYVEILDLVDDDVTIIEKVFSLQNSLQDRLDDLESGGVKANQEAINQLQSNLNQTVVDITAQLKTAKDQLEAQYETFKNDFEDRLGSIEGRMATAELDISLLKDATVDFGLRGDLNALAAKVDEAIGDSDTSIAALEANLSTLDNQINNADDGLAIVLNDTKNTAEYAKSSARDNIKEIENIKDNFAFFNKENNMCVGEDLGEIIIFSCGNAEETIVVEN